MKIRVITACILLIASVAVSLFACNVSTITADEAYKLGERILLNSKGQLESEITIKLEDVFGKWRISGTYEFEDSEYVDVVEIGKRSGRVEKCILFKSCGD